MLTAITLTSPKPNMSLQSMASPDSSVAEVKTNGYAHADDFLHVYASLKDAVCSGQFGPAVGCRSLKGKASSTTHRRPAPMWKCLWR